MADRPETESERSETRAREGPPLTAEQFIATPSFKKGMRKILKVSKVELDKRVRSRKPQQNRDVMRKNKDHQPTP
jgi:hypothetical protein